MSKSFKQDSKKRMAGKNYQIESLEPRFLMDASSGYSADEWNKELSCIVAPSVWTNLSELKQNEAEDLIVDGLFVVNKDTAVTERAKVSDLLDCDGVAETDFGFFELNDMLYCVQEEIREIIGEFPEDVNITAKQLFDELKKEQSTTYSYGDFKSKVYYHAESVRGGRISLNITAEKTLDKQDKLDKKLSVDLSKTTVEIESKFDFSSYTQKLDFTFILDGDASNDVDLSSTATFTVKFDEGSGEEFPAKFGVLGLSKDSGDVTIESKWDVSSKWNASTKKLVTESKIENGLGAVLSYNIQEFEDTFTPDKKSGKYEYIEDVKYIYQKDVWDNDESKIRWNNTDILKYKTFSMGKILEKLQGISAKLTAIQNGDYYDNNVDFGGSLSRNAHSLLDLSDLLADVINNPPSTLQELVSRLKENEYSTYDDKKAQRIEVQAKGISIPVSLKISNPNFPVALSKDWLETFFNVEVLENKFVRVDSDATLKFNLFVPFFGSERATAADSLYRLGLNQGDEQLSAVIGAKAIVAEEMDHYYAGESSLSKYVDSIKGACSNKYGSKIKNLNSCVDNDAVSYALYYNLRSEASVLTNQSADDNEGLFDLSRLAEFKGVTPKEGFVVKWNSSYRSITYENINQDRKEFVASSIDEFVSLLASVFSRSENKCVQKLRVVSIGNNYIAVLFDANQIPREDVPEDESAETYICDDLKEYLTIDGFDVESAFKVGNLKEIWLSNELPPARYNVSAKMTVVVGAEAHDIDFGAGYFNTASSVGEIASCLQEMINLKFRWEIDDPKNEIEYKPAQLLVESYEGRIRFVSLQDYSVDFHDEDFAEWLGFESYVSAFDAKWQTHVVVATSEKDLEKHFIDELYPSARIDKNKTDDLENSFEMLFTVDGSSKTVKMKKSDFESAKWSVEYAEIIQKKINAAFGWKADAALLYVISYDDKICFKASKEFTVGTTDRSVLSWLGFYDFSPLDVGGKTVLVVNKYHTFYSEKIELDDIYGLKADVAISFVVGDDRLDVVLDYKKMKDLDSLGALRGYIEQQIENSYADKDSSMPLDVLCRNGGLCFRSVENFTIRFSSSTCAKVLGFSSRAIKDENSSEYVAVLPESTIKYEDVVKMDSVEVTVGISEDNRMEELTFSLSLASIVELYQKQKTPLKNCTVKEILGALVLKINSEISAAQNHGEILSYFVLDGVTIVAAEGYEMTHRILEIKDINGYTIASVLGLCGKYGVNPDYERESFFVDANLVEDAIDDDSKVPLLKDFYLRLSNKIVDGKIDVDARYGIFGEKITGDLTGFSCITRLKHDNLIRLSGLGKLSYDYTENGNLSNKALDVSLDPLLTGGDTVFKADFKFNKDKNEVTITPHVDNAKEDPSKKYGLNTENGGFNQQRYSMVDLYDDLSQKMYGKWINTYFSKADTSSLNNIQLPILGSSILEMMGMRNKFEELNEYLTKIRSGSNVQEVIDYITNRIGIDVAAKYKHVYETNTTTLKLSFTWSSSIYNQPIELDSLNLGRNDFSLNGLFHAYIKASLKFSCNVYIVTKNNSSKAHMTVGTPTLEGNLTLDVNRISTDIEINSLEQDAQGNKILKQAEFQVESLSSNKSSVHLSANIEDNKNVHLSLKGLLYVYKYGADAGCIDIYCDETVSKTPKTVVYYSLDGNQTALGEVKSGSVKLSLENVKDLCLKETGLFDKFRSSVDGLSNTVRRLQSSLNATLVSGNIRHIPLVGESVVNIGDSLSFLNEEFIEPLRKFVYKKTDGLNAYTVTEKLYSLLRNYIHTGTTDSLAQCNDGSPVWWAQKKFNRYYHGIQFYESEDEAYWHLRLCLNYALEKNADFDLGFPGLGLRADGGVQIDLSVVLDIGFGISKTDGVFILLSNGYEEKPKSNKDETELNENGTEHVGDDLRITLRVKPNASIEGSLGFLAMTANVQNTVTDPIILGVDLNDGHKLDSTALDDRNTDRAAKTIIRMRELMSGLSTEANLRGEINLKMPMSLGIGGYSVSAPHIDTELNVNWSSDFGTGMGDLNAVAFNNIVFDCGSFVKNTIGGVVQKINKVIDPVRPIIKFLQSEIPVLNKLPAGGVHITVLDLVKKFGNKKKMNFGFLDDIIEIDNMVKKLDGYANKGIYIGSWNVIQTGENVKKDKKDDGLRFIRGQIANVEKFVTDNLEKCGFKESYVDKLSGYVDTVSSIVDNPDAYVDYANEAISDKVASLKSVASKWSLKSSEGSSTSEIQKPEFGGNWMFPIIDNPSAEIMKILAGGHADLVIFDMKPLKFSFDWSKSFPIIGPLCADVGFSFGVDIDLCFGYDTYGVERWARSNFKNFGALIDGFYVADWDPVSGEDVAEVLFHSGVVAGASVGGRFGVNVGLNLNVNLDFKDPNDDGKIRLTEMAEMLSLNPLDTFDVSASISARAYAYLDVVFYRKEWTLWSSGALDLFSTASKQKDALASRCGENLVVNVGEYAKENSVKAYSEDGDDIVKIRVTDSDVVDISLGEGEDAVHRSYKVKENNLCIYAGEGRDHIEISCDKKVSAKFNIIVYGGNDDDCIDFSNLSLADGFFAIAVGSAGSDFIAGSASGTNYLFGDDGDWGYTPESKDKKKKVVAQAYSYPAEAGDTDVILGGSGAVNYIFGGAGSDFIVGGASENFIFADYGRIRNVNGKMIADRHDVFDDGGDDLVYGNSGVDHIYGGAGSDWILANKGNDEIYGGQGNDVLLGGSGDDAIYGGDGTDVIFGDAPFKSDMVIARGDNDKQLGALLPYTLVAHDLKGMVDIEGKYISPFFEMIDKNGVEIDAIKMFDFVDKYVDGSLDSVTKWANVLLKEELKKQKIEDATTADASDLAKALKKIFKDFAPVETSVTNGSDVIDGGNGADVIFGDDGQNASGNTIPKGGDDIITGGAGNDFVDGDGGDDTINAGSGMDIVYGGRGNDTLDGGIGDDFVFGDDGWADYDNSTWRRAGWFGGSEISSYEKRSFGETIATVTSVFDISDKAKSNAGGDDTIVAGNDSDFVDGQGGNDSYKIRFMGGPNETFTNVMDSGNDTNDSMTVYGTLIDDNILIRNSDRGLGMIGLLPDGADKTALERVNYWRSDVNGGVDFVSIESDDGDDLIAVDGTLTAMSIDSGSGDDVINVGQRYDFFIEHGYDCFDHNTIMLQQGHLSIGNQHSLYVNGGVGKNVYNVLHVNGALSIQGGSDRMDMALYNLFSFIGSDGSVVKNKGVVTLFGKDSWGTGRPYFAYNYTTDNGYTTTLEGIIKSQDFSGVVNFYGTSLSDTFIYTDTALLSDAYEVLFYGAGYYNIDVRGGDKVYHAYNDMDASENSTTTNQFKKLVSSLKTNTANNIEVLFTRDYQAGEPYPGGTNSDIKNADYVRMLEVEEGSKARRFGIKLSKKPQGTVTVRITVPEISEESWKRGERGVMIKDGENKVKTKILTFNSSDFNQLKYIEFEVEQDSVLMDCNFSSLMIDVTSTSQQDLVESSSLPFYQKKSLETDMNDFVETTLNDECYVQLKYSTVGMSQSDIDALRFDLQTSKGRYLLTAQRREFEEGYFFKLVGSRIYICDNQTGLPSAQTGTMCLLSGSFNMVYSMNYRISHDPDVGALYTRFGRSRVTSFTQEKLDKIGPAIPVAYPETLMFSGEKRRNAPPAPAAAPAAPVIASSDAAGISTEVVLEEGLPGFISVGEDETIRFKIYAPKSANPSVALMVNSEDGKSLPALTWIWDDVNKKRKSVMEELDLSYQVDISDAESEDDFIYVYLHAAKACQFVASALVG